MFYYKNWDRFCSWIESSNLQSCTAEDSLEINSITPFIVLKHDVEGNVPKALKLAQIEHSHGIKGSYYVQAFLLESDENIKILQQIKDLGHEVSYHYDVLDACNGDFIKAESEFDRILNLFHHNGFTFRTVCQHGNPVKKRIGYNSNRDFFRNHEIKSRHSNLVDMVVDYSKYTKQPYMYISDAGYMWKHITEPESNDINHNAANIEIGSFDKLKKYITENHTSIILSTHPHRWENTSLKINSRILIFKIIRKVARTLQKNPLMESIMNRFYFIAKKI